MTIRAGLGRSVAAPLAAGLSLLAVASPALARTILPVEASDACGGSLLWPFGVVLLGVIGILLARPMLPVENTSDPDTSDPDASDLI
jgi:hypothetical protein